jgi:hypothetical protein
MRRSDHTRLINQGIVVAPQVELLTPAMFENPILARDAAFKAAGYANDAIPGLITTPSAGVPAYLANLMDPEEVRVITAPMRAAEAYGETQKGNWTTFTTTFRVIESTGETSSYGDYSENGRAGHNVSWVARESYHFQTFARWGERDVDVEALAGINYVSEQSVAAALVLNKFANQAAFLGIAGLKCYGALNDPSLIAPIAPGAKTSPNSPTWGPATPPEQIFADFQLLFQQLQIQMGGNAERTAAMTLVLSPTKEVWLENANSFGVRAIDLIERGFKALKIVTAPEMTAGGDLMQLRLDKVDGKDTTYTGFTEKMRNHVIVQRASSWAQKKSAGTWGFINRYPIAIAQMLGI